MISIIEYARLAFHVYYPKEKEIDGANIGTIDKKKPHTEWYRITDVDTDMQPTNHFYAQLYIKFKGNKATDAVMAIRGTDLDSGAFIAIGNLWEDGRSWWSDVLLDGKNVMMPHYLGQALRFYHRCQDYVQHYFPDLSLLIPLTGHSLGGAVAQLLMLKACAAAPVVSFNAPGCGHMPGILTSQAAWVVNINAKYGFINKIGPTLGAVHSIEGLPKDAEAKRLFDTFDQATEQSKQLNQQAAQEEKAIMHSYEAAKKLNDRRQCYEAAVEFNYNLPLYEAAAGVRLWAYLESTLKDPEAIEVILTEHKMQDLLAALHRAENKGLADSFAEGLLANAASKKG